MPFHDGRNARDGTPPLGQKHLTSILMQFFQNRQASCFEFTDTNLHTHKDHSYMTSHQDVTSFNLPAKMPP
ncbi:MAG TPA: hypothetical protein PKY05_09590, partial [Fibrobacteria bacterium]|nr:hypothetical protein [Fibrobacteria bacterium]